MNFLIENISFNEFGTYLRIYEGHSIIENDLIMDGFYCILFLN